MNSFLKTQDADNQYTSKDEYKTFLKWYELLKFCVATFKNFLNDPQGQVINQSIHKFSINVFQPGKKKPQVLSSAITSS